MWESSFMRLLKDFYTDTSFCSDGVFSIAELSACALDGDVSLVDFTYVLNDCHQDTYSRARIVGSCVDGRCVVASWSAAWVHGAIAYAPLQHTVALRDGLRIRLSPDRRYDIAQMSFDASDVMGTYGAFVTTPLRTAIDLARFTPSDVRLRGALISLLWNAQVSFVEVQDVIERGNNLPYKQRAYRRLSDVLTFMAELPG